MVGVAGRRTRRSTAESHVTAADVATPSEKNHSSANSVDSASTASSTAPKKRPGLRKSTRIADSDSTPRVSQMTTRRQARHTKAAPTERVQRYQSLRTSVFKSYKPLPAPKKPATWNEADTANANGYTYRRGDIVAIIDEDDGNPYFAQISTFLIDPHGQPHAVIVYLIPLHSVFDPHDFSEDHFVHGVAAFDPVDLRECQFVQRCPQKENYQKQWSLKMCLEQQMRHELQERLRDLKTVSVAEFHSYGTSPYYIEPLAPPSLVEPKIEEDDLASKS